MPGAGKQECIWTDIQQSNDWPNLILPLTLGRYCCAVEGGKNPPFPFFSLLPHNSSFWTCIRYFTGTTPRRERGGESMDGGDIIQHIPAAGSTHPTASQPPFYLSPLHPYPTLCHFPPTSTTTQALWHPHWHNTNSISRKWRRPGPANLGVQCKNSREKQHDLERKEVRKNTYPFLNHHWSQLEKSILPCATFWMLTISSVLVIKGWFPELVFHQKYCFPIRYNIYHCYNQPLL